VHRNLIAAFVCLISAATVAADPIRLANNPALSPDGQLLAFDWNGDIWSVSVNGGTARQLTAHSGRDRQPKFSPDGKQLAFVSDRNGSPQAYTMPVEGGPPAQVTFHTAGCSLVDWTPDGKRLLLHGSRDHFWRRGERFFTVSATERSPEVVIFDDYGANGSISPDATKLLFTREGAQWWRKGYHGSQASQIWLFDEPAKKFTNILNHDRGSLWPMWKPNNGGFYYVGGQTGNFNLYEFDPATNESRQLTKFPDDSVVFPCISRDGSMIVFRHLFDLYRLRPGSAEGPQKIEIECAADRVPEKRDRKVLTTANQVAFSNDGLEIAFIAGGDLWVMDTELREPRQITATPEEESSPVYSPEGDSILFISNVGGKSDVVRAERSDKAKHWFLNQNFKLTPLTEDGVTKSRLTWSPDGSHVAFLKDRGELWMMDPAGKNAKQLVRSFSSVDYDWSPDGKWMVATYEDEDFNRDVHIFPIDGSKPPYNVSRTPTNESDPAWSSDGKMIAFTGRNGLTETDIYYVWLRADDDETSSRDRTMEKALEKINKGRRSGGSGVGRRSEPPPSDPPAEGAQPPAQPTTPRTPRRPEVTIDFDDLHERVKHISLADSNESGLFFSADGKDLLFTGSIDGRRGTYSVKFPDAGRPTLFMSSTVSQPRWLRTGNQIVGLVNGVPTSVSVGASGRPSGGGGSATASAPTGGGGRGRGGAGAPAASSGGGDESTGTAYRFQAFQEVDLPKKHAAAFDLAWRTMRDNWYDGRLNNRDWNAVRAKYIDMAAAAPDTDSFATVVQLMLGELNGSHLGFTPSSGGGGGGPPRRRGAPPAEEPSTATTWRETTAHLGVRFDPTFEGPGWKIRDVLPGGPADQKKSRLEVGEIILSIDGKDVDRKTDVPSVLNGPPNRDIALKVKGADGKDRDVVIRPTSFNAVRGLLYQKWLDDNRKAVDEWSKGKLGYIHIDAMSMPSFWKFEKELFAAGAGKEGLIIDVRENGGGSTADHLLTALTQPVHAVTVPRGGSPGYPQDRKVYATWNKPIVVMCNQNSFSNAEIFSHAIKTLNRGHLVGVPTAGGVISTGAASIMDMGTIRLPTRGWFVVGTGEDMELNGAVPHHIVWPEPGQTKDIQLTKAVEVLLEDVQAWKTRPQTPLKKASERK
jgi:tricorn protease